MAVKRLLDCSESQKKRNLNLKSYEVLSLFRQGIRKGKLSPQANEHLL